jgi:predicted MFS family arabinose efflux permease
MKNIAIIVFLYYTAVWAVVSTLMVYVTRHLQFSPIYVGWLLSCYGVATMFSEGVLVRLVE